ncbi:uncharacterized protein PAC_13593 [Phialocephala subalpina]|uniref:NAD(P)-binding protein n=1 Tax=Phialocephala subalpina TaxID=576137 RepID=A0A1L7XFF1_9HELO|nr:uncharacterized protein PAC_13593 [Phialocephala subalpina]
MSFPRDLHDCNHSTDPRTNPDLAKALRGQNAIVAGAGRGVGRAISEMLVYASCASITLLALEKEEVEETARICKQINPDIKTKSAVVDVTDFTSVERIVKEIVEEFGSIDVLAMNAGRPPQWLPVSDSDPKIWWDTVSISLQGAFVYTRAVLPIMKKQAKGGRIIYTSSSGAHLNSGMGSYIVGKLGQVRLAEVVHKENWEEGVRCFAFNPGCVKTRFYTDFEDEVVGREKRVGSYVQEEVEGEKESAEMAVNTLKDATFDTPYMAAGLVTALAAGELDFMSGRYLDAAVDIQNYIDREEEIVSKDLCRVRLNLGNGELEPRLDY